MVEDFLMGFSFIFVLMLHAGPLWLTQNTQHCDPI
jgi:hypothetical protein